MKKPFTVLVLLVSLIFLSSIVGCQNLSKSITETNGINDEKERSSGDVTNEEEEFINDTNEEKEGSIDVDTTMQKWKTRDGVVWVHGAAKIVNTGNIPIELGSVSFIFHDKNHSELLKSESILPIPFNIDPGEVAYASTSEKIYMVSNVDQVAEVSFIIGQCHMPMEDNPLLKIKNINIIPSKNPLYSFKISGKVMNPEITQGAICIALAMFDKNGELLGVYKDYPNFVPNEELKFETFFPPIGVKNFDKKIASVDAKAEVLYSDMFDD